MRTQVSDSEHWSIQDGAALYGLDRWAIHILNQ